MKNMIKFAGDRETMLNKEITQLKQSNRQLMGFGEMREKLLQEELIAIKKEIMKIQESFNDREIKGTQEREAYQKELEEY